MRRRNHPAILDPRRWRRVRLRVLDRDGWRCRTCGKAGGLEVDHIKPVHHGGDPWALANLQALCAWPCHGEKTRRENTRDTPARRAWRALVADLL